MLTSEEIEEVLQKIPAGFKKPDDDFFASADKSFLDCYKKLGVISAVEESIGISTDNSQMLNDAKKQIFCNVPTCCRYFETVFAYQTHFNSVHRYICVQCNKSLPTSHLLDLHISEQHDSYFAARLERGEPMYACLLEECKLRYQTQAERKEHCITEHNFPSNFRFDQVQKTSTQGGSGGTKQRSHDLDITSEELVADSESTNHLSKKQSTFSFGHQKNKTFNFKKSEKVISKIHGETLQNMRSLKEALDGMS